MKIRRRELALGLLLSASATVTAFAAGATAARVDARRLAAAEKEPGQWMSYGGTYSEQRFSGLTQVTSDNVGQLGLQWYADYETNQN